ncbi:N-acetylmuramate alpha-1-phosphate uridylyltransferase MurU [Zwartia sp.]|uniref:N-acetylmuramate alpha-1-phosphate uridylyltransferase MurU n=1 Tax=Zwartia sp. TaxID=2978004 RepID=UPI003BB1C656
MRAMILAAGRGERMRPLTDTVPKPLLPVAGKPLIQWHIEKLAAAGITEIVINHAWLGALIEHTLKDGRQWGVNLHYSAETVALETAGGIATALPLLGTEPFLVMNGDIWCDWNPLQALQIGASLAQSTQQAWLLLVPNPDHHPKGDFGLMANGLITDTDSPAEAQKHTFSGIGVYKPSLFAQTPAHQPAKLAPLLRQAIARKGITGQLHQGAWIDVGTPERLNTLECMLKS